MPKKKTTRKRAERVALHLRLPADVVDDLTRTADDLGCSRNRLITLLLTQIVGMSKSFEQPALFDPFEEIIELSVKRAIERESPAGVLKGGK